jgi:Domain of Unknown Function with PDB structure (DUF3857)/Transglutaminase-like superfamily
LATNSPEEMSQRTPKIEPDADAEALIWEVRVDDSGEGLSLKHYIRVKIFTERGRDKFSKIDIPFLKGYKIQDIGARVIKADGSIVELKKEDVFDRDIIKAESAKVKAKSFAVAGIDVGVIFEYRYREFLPSGWANNMRMVFQRDIPMQNVSYYFRPTDGWNTKSLSFNMKGSAAQFVKDKGGYYRATMVNVPSIKEEPNMPPEDEVRSWAFVFYTQNNSLDVDKYWSNAGGALVESYDVKDTLKPGGDIKKALPAIIAGAENDVEKLNKIYEFCLTKIRNLSYDTTLTDEDREKLKFNKSTSETLKKQQGFSLEINDLFASLAVAAGFEARLVFSGDRSEIFFTEKHAHSSFVHPAGIAVSLNPLKDLKLGKDINLDIFNVKGLSLKNWKYFKPGNPFIKRGMLSWFEENQTAFLLGAKDYFQLTLPMTNYKDSNAKRTGKFKLLEDGTLEGDVKIEYSGHLASQYKINNYDDSASKQEETLKDDVKKTMSTSELSNISIENLKDPNLPFVYNYKIKVPNYAQKTGKRMFFQPGFFEYGSTPRFVAAKRTYPIYFRFPWSETDEIEIELPKGFALDNAESPSGIADPDKITSLDFNVSINKATNVLTYKRQFHFGGGDTILFQSGLYPQVKAMFDNFNKADSQIITLKQN